MGVAGTVPEGVVVGLGCHEYPVWVSYKWTGEKAHH